MTWAGRHPHSSPATRAGYTCDRRARLSQIEHTKAGDWLTRYDYGLDPAGNRVAITETTTAVRTLYMPALGRPAPGAGGEGASAPPYGQVIRYSYDELDRLTAAQYSNGDRYGYAYDPVGNRVAYTVTAQSLVTETTSYTYDAADRLTSVNGTPHTYDNRGNLLSDSTWAYTSAGRFAYNGHGLRVAESVNGIETAFTWDQALARRRPARRRAASATSTAWGGSASTRGVTGTTRSSEVARGEKPGRG